MDGRRMDGGAGGAAAPSAGLSWAGSEGASRCPRRPPGPRRGRRHGRPLSRCPPAGTPHRLRRRPGCSHTPSPPPSPPRRRRERPQRSRSARYRDVATGAARAGGRRRHPGAGAAARAESQRGDSMGPSCVRPAPWDPNTKLRCLRLMFILQALKPYRRDRSDTSSEKCPSFAPSFRVQTIYKHSIGFILT